jgi:uncharacterized MAPEG superfamily protein
MLSSFLSIRREAMMTTELWYLFWTSVLLAALWIPFVIGSVKTAGPLQPEEYRFGRNVEFPPWVRRADRAHVNLVEQFGPFAALVVIAHLAGIHNAVTVWCAALFFWIRVLHAVVYVSGFSRFRTRTVLFTLAFVVLLVYAWQIFANAAPAGA